MNAIRRLALAVVCLAAPGGVVLPAAAQDGTTCTDFDAYEWAQSVYDADPDENEALDPDGDGIACPELPRGGAAPALFAAVIPARTAEATLLDVVDGDTIEIETDRGEEATVRLIGVDTPETRDPRRGVQCFGAEATAFTEFLLGLTDGRLYVERDVSDEDRYGRLLRYVWLDIGGEPYLLNEAIARSGYGDSSAYPPDVKYQDEIDDAERFARDYELGLWSACGGPDVPLSEVQPGDAVTGQDGGGAPGPAPTDQGTQADGQATEGADPTDQGPAEGAVVPPDAVVVPPDEQVVVPPDEQVVDPPPVDTPPDANAGCDPSYPELCLPVGAGDLDCPEVGAANFTVLPPDPHGFDRDQDGVGCEG